MRETATIPSSVVTNGDANPRGRSTVRARNSAGVIPGGGSPGLTITTCGVNHITATTKNSGDESAPTTAALHRREGPITSAVDGGCEGALAGVSAPYVSAPYAS